VPLLERKFEEALSGHLTDRKRQAVLDLFADPDRLQATPVPDFMILFQTPG